MKFKVGDKVRYDRDFLIDTITTRDYDRNSGLRGFEVVQIEGEEVRSEDGFWFHESHLELIPEKCEFEYGDRIEVSNDNKNRLERMFITKSNKSDYAVMYYKEIDDYPDAIHYTIEFYKYARKLRPQLTRKKIARKFGIDKDFIFIDE